MSGNSALSFGIAALLSNILGITWDGAPYSIAFGILGIASAITSKKDGVMAKKAKVGLIFSIIAIIFGIIIYMLISYAVQILTDPEMSKQFIELFNQVKDQLPADYQQYIDSFSF